MDAEFTGSFQVAWKVIHEDTLLCRKSELLQSIMIQLRIRFENPELITVGLAIKQISDTVLFQSLDSTRPCIGYDWISKLYGGVVKLYGGEPWGSDEKSVKNEFKMKA